MKLLSRKDELILLTIWKLQDGEGAYGVTIREYIERMTGVAWVFGAIYSPLARLLQSGLVEACESETLFRLTDEGRSALRAVRELSEALWNDAASLAKARKP
jgi:DNA-binding PadR family transcriptional regulator